MARFSEAMRRTTKPPLDPDMVIWTADVPAACQLTQKPLPAGPRGDASGQAEEKSDTYRCYVKPAASGAEAALLRRGFEVGGP